MMGNGLDPELALLMPLDIHLRYVAQITKPDRETGQQTLDQEHDLSSGLTLFDPREI
tara:strand:+ start:425 stop:595 length:171 start_codon:yes stop_codon:yes gene_type:complete